MIARVLSGGRQRRYHPYIVEIVAATIISAIVIFALVWAFLVPYATQQAEKAIFPTCYIQYPNGHAVPCEAP